MSEASVFDSNQGEGDLDHETKKKLRKARNRRTPS